MLLDDFVEADRTEVSSVLSKELNFPFLWTVNSVDSEEIDNEQVRFIRWNETDLVLQTDSKSLPIGNAKKWNVYQSSGDELRRVVGKITTYTGGTEGVNVTGYFVLETKLSFKDESFKGYVDFRVLSQDNSRYIAARPYVLKEEPEESDERPQGWFAQFVSTVLALFGFGTSTAQCVNPDSPSSLSVVPTTPPSIWATSTFRVKIALTQKATAAIKSLEHHALSTEQAIESYVVDRFDELKSCYYGQFPHDYETDIGRYDHANSKRRSCLWAWQVVQKPGCNNRLTPDGWQDILDTTDSTAVTVFLIDPKEHDLCGHAQLFAEPETALIVARVGGEAQLVLPHEFGHLYGMGHKLGQNVPQYNYGIAYEDTSEGFQTVVGISNQVRIPVFSTDSLAPNVDWSYSQFGDSNHNNSKVFEINYQRIANF